MTSFFDGAEFAAECEQLVLVDRDSADKSLVESQRRFRKEKEYIPLHPMQSAVSPELLLLL